MIARELELMFSADRLQAAAQSSTGPRAGAITDTLLRGETIVTIKKIIFASVIAAALSALSITACAQMRASGAGKPTKNINGVWLVNLTLNEPSTAQGPQTTAPVINANTQSPFIAIETFHDDGTFSENSLTDYLPPAGTP